MLNLNREYQVVVGGIAISSFIFPASRSQPAKIYKERIKAGRFSFEKDQKITCYQDKVGVEVGQWKYINSPQFLFTCSDRDTYTNQNTVIINTRKMEKHNGFNELFDFYTKIQKNITVLKDMNFELIPIVNKVMSHAWLLVVSLCSIENRSIIEHIYKNTGIVSMIIPPSGIFWDKQRRVTNEEKLSLFLPLSEKMVSNFGANIIAGAQIQGAPNQNIFPTPVPTRIEATTLKNIYREPTEKGQIEIEQNRPTIIHPGRIRGIPLREPVPFTITNLDQDPFFDIDDPTE